MGKLKKKKTHSVIVKFLKALFSQKWRRMPLIPALEKQRGKWIFEFEAALVYRASFSTARATDRNPVSKQTNNK